MKCPIDQTEMEKGSIYGLGKDVWRSDTKNTFGVFSKYEKIFAYRCPKCGKIELIAEIK